MTDQAEDAGRDRYFGFDSAYLAKLERLAVISRRPVVGAAAGPRRSSQHGASVEFADFRDYAHGDDFRRIDWNAYARLDRLFLRLYVAEQMTTVTLFLDHSPSMNFGQPLKSLTVARLAATLSFVALQNYDRVAIVGWGDKVDRRVPVQSGKEAIARTWRSIADVMSAAAGPTDFSALRTYAASQRTPGLAIVISDFLTDSDWRGGLRSLRGRGLEVSAIQVLAQEELRPELRGDWTLLDSETGVPVEVTVSPRLLRRYKDELAAHTTVLRDFCHRQGIAFMQLPSDISFEVDVLQSLRFMGVLG